MFTSKVHAFPHADHFHLWMLLRYCFKPPDHVNVELNEISAFLSGRLLSAAEATFRILGLRLHQEWPAVERLDLHLPAEHIVVFNPMDDEADIQEMLPTATTKLLQWFVLNQNDPAARALRYVDIPEHYIWQDHQWKRRVQNRMKVARLPTVSCHNLELSALRMILMVATGAVSFMDLLTWNGHTYSTFRDAAHAAGMFEDQDEAMTVFSEMARVGVSVTSLREQFCTVLVHCAPVKPVELFHMFAPDLVYGEVTETSCNAALIDIDRIMRITYGKSLRDAEYNFNFESNDIDAEVLIPPIADVDPNVGLLETLRPLLSVDQLQAIDCVMDSVLHDIGFNVFGVFSSAGTGKTLFANFVACSLRSQGKVVVCVAASALAASLLEGGHTAHHTLHIPIPAHESTYCSFSAAERKLIRQAALIIWDEASMIHQDIADTVSRSLQDIMQVMDRPFGGKTVIFMGDFKQLLPVVRGGTNSSIGEQQRSYVMCLTGKGDNHTIQRCQWWPAVRRLEFLHNWRASQDIEFATLLESVGSGRLPEVCIPMSSQADSMQDLVQQVMGQDLNNADNAAMVLTLTLEDTQVVNNWCLNSMPGRCHEMHAADTFLNCRQPDLYPPEVVAAMHIPGVPPGKLSLKVGARYMIVKNMMKHVFNGVRCVLLSIIGSKSVFVRLISGPGAGDIILLPSVIFAITPEQSGLPFSIRRRQLPMIPAFAVTVHKAQGQTLSKVGIYITTPMFTHGQLYTALSRTRGWSNIRVYSTLPNPHIIRNYVCAHVL